MGKIISLDDNLKVVYESAAKQILNYTPQLYIKSTKNSNSVKPFGSGVLFSRNDNYYLLTAAHCIKQAKDLIK